LRHLREHTEHTKALRSIVRLLACNAARELLAGSNDPAGATPSDDQPSKQHNAGDTDDRSD